MACFPGTSVAAQVPDTIAEIRVHGNHRTPDADILNIAGLHVGEPASANRLAEAEETLRASGRFAGVEVRRRHRSIANPSEILVMLLVEERARSAWQWHPMLRYVEGHGLTYGARLAAAPAGSTTGVSIPLTWGGERHAAFEVERRFERGPLTSLAGSASAARSVNPHLAVTDTRRSASIEATRSLTAWLRAATGAQMTHVSFGGVEDRYPSAGARLIVDTRLDPLFPRNALHARAGVEHFGFDGGRAERWSADSRAYLGIGTAVLVLRANTTRASEMLPPFEQALLGGADSVRGFRAGFRAGDSLAVASAEVRLPLTSPFSVGRFGVKAFVDAGSVWNDGQRVRKQHFDRGVGGGVYFGGPALGGGVDVAWPRTGHARWHFAVSFAQEITR